MESLLRKLDLTSLRLFVAVCQEKNIARAAEREFIVPSAVSRRISEIEAMVGLPVIQRHQRGITVTPVGETILRHAQVILGQIEALGVELSQFNSGAKGTVRVVANLSSIVQFLPEDVAAFSRFFPDVAIELEEQSSAEVLKTVEERNADVGICNAIAGIEHFEHLPYRSDRLFAMLPLNHPRPAGAPVCLADLLDENFIALRDGSALTQLLAQEVAHLGSKMNIRIRVSSLDALCRMVHVGLGLAIVPEHVGELYVNTLDVKLLPLTDPWALRHLFLVFRARDQINASANTLIDFLSVQR